MTIDAGNPVSDDALSRLADVVPTFDDAFIQRRSAWVMGLRRDGVEGVFKAQALALPLPPSFHDALRVPCAERCIIAEFKRRSPGRPQPTKCVSPDQFAVCAERLGVTALSIRVDDEHHGGCYADLLSMAQRTSLPILCRDIMVDPLQITMARAHGAAAIVLSPQLLPDREFRAMYRHALDLGLDILVEVRSAQDLEQAAKTRRGASDNGSLRIVGVDGCPPDGPHLNCVTYERLAPTLPEHAVRIALSGILDEAHVARIASLGYDAFLVGDALLDCESIDTTLRELLGEPINGVGPA